MNKALVIEGVPSLAISPWKPKVVQQALGDPPTLMEWAEVDVKTEGSWLSLLHDFF